MDNSSTTNKVSTAEGARSSPAPPQSPANQRRLSAYDMTSTSTSASPMGGINERQHLTKLSPGLPVDMMHNAREASFPVKLHQLLSTSDDRIIRWQPKNDGKSFTILNCEAFEAEVLPRLYRTANIEMFGQLLSLYGFQRVESGPYEGDYYHTLFVKDKPHLAHMIRKGGQVAPTDNPTANPTAYAPVPQKVAESMALNHSLASSMHATVTSRLAGLSFPSKLHYLLCHGIYDLGLEGIMRWQPGGHAFAIYSSEDFEIQGLAEMLGTPGHASFRAQLFLHGFQRVRSDGPDVEAYYHAEFVREQPQLCRLIRSRNHLKSNIIRRTPSTPTASRRSIVSPLSDISMKSTISALPDGLFLDSRQSLVLSPEAGSHSLSSLKAPPPPPPLTAAASAASAAPSTQTGDDKKGSPKPRKRPRVGHMMPQNYFPFKLHSLLTLAEKFGFQNILCWAPHGRCFLVNDKDLFCATVLPLFRHSEFASFRAQLKAYGFVRIGKSGPDKGAYYHMSFLRGQPELCATITRRPKNVNGTVRGRPKGRSYVEPDFYKMKFLPDLDVEQTVAPPGNIKDILEAALTQITPPAVVTREVSTPSGVIIGAPQKATDSQAISLTRNTQDVVAKLVKQNDSQETSLPVKLHALLNDAHDHSFNRIVTWNDSGRSFSISDEKVFGDILCEKWLNIPSLADFQAELAMYGFKRRQNEPHKGAYYHEMFHKALPHLCRCIKKEETKVPACDSSLDSHQPVIVIDKPSSAVAESTPVDSSMSTLSAGSAGKRTNSPELEVAMALTAMDDRSAEGEPAAMESMGDVSPLTSDNHRTAPIEEAKGNGLFVPELGTDGAKSPLVPKNESSAVESDTKPSTAPAPAPLIQPIKESANKRRSCLDPPASCDMLAVDEAAKQTANETSEREDNDAEMKDLNEDHPPNAKVNMEIDLTGTASDADDTASEETPKTTPSPTDDSKPTPSPPATPVASDTDDTTPLMPLRLSPLQDAPKTIAPPPLPSDSSPVKQESTETAGLDTKEAPTEASLTESTKMLSKEASKDESSTSGLDLLEPLVPV